MSRIALTGATVFDGAQLHPDAVLLLDGARIAALTDHVPAGVPVQRLAGGVLAPGMVDLQVNGGGGRMVGAQTDAAALAQLCAVHARLGASGGILPTLITDRPEVTAMVIAAAIAASDAPGFLGLHLEGPHLDPRRKGAHDAALIRPMSDSDCDLLCAAAPRLPRLLVTVAPEAAAPARITRLVQAGVIVSLGHSDTDAAGAQRAFDAGATMATHLFNAMSQLGNREPGLVGAVLSGDAMAGLIADGRHIAPDSLRIALAARPQGLFLVSDAMAVAGTDLPDFTLGGRRVLRSGGRLVLEDGTLAGADLTLPQAVAWLIRDLGVAPARALAMSTAIPAAAIGRDGSHGHIAPGRAADLVHLSPDWQLAAVWQAGRKLTIAGA